MEPNVKIFVSCHKRCKLVQNEIIEPIQVGTDLAKEKFDDMLHDNEGDNISKKNKRYCELTAQYWAWKNVDADYYGFMHYRRYFSFSNKTIPYFPFDETRMRSLSDKNIKRLCLEPRKILETVKDYDILIPPRFFVLSNYWRYVIARNHFKKDIDFCLNVIKNDYPQIYPYAKKSMRSPFAYLCNMFIFKKEIFNEYSKWLFDILLKHEKAMPCENYNAIAYRVSGFLAERLCGIYITFLKSKKLKVKTLQKVKIRNTNT